MNRGLRTSGFVDLRRLECQLLVLDTFWAFTARMWRGGPCGFHQWQLVRGPEAGELKCGITNLRNTDSPWEVVGSGFGG